MSDKYYKYYSQHRCPKCDHLYVGELNTSEEFWCSPCEQFVYPPTSYYGPLPKRSEEE